MGDWSHTVGIIRARYVEGITWETDVETFDWDAVLGKTRPYGMLTETAEETEQHPEKYMPALLAKSVHINKEHPSREYIISFGGDREDGGLIIREIRVWLKRICPKLDIQQMVVKVEIQGVRVVYFDWVNDHLVEFETPYYDQPYHVPR